MLHCLLVALRAGLGKAWAVNLCWSLHVRRALRRRRCREMVQDPIQFSALRRPIWLICRRQGRRVRGARGMLSQGCVTRTRQLAGGPRAALQIIRIPIQYSARRLRRSVTCRRRRRRGIVLNHIQFSVQRLPMWEICRRRGRRTLEVATRFSLDSIGAVVVVGWGPRAVRSRKRCQRRSGGVSRHPRSAALGVWPVSGALVGVVHNATSPVLVARTCARITGNGRWRMGVWMGRFPITN